MSEGLTDSPTVYQRLVAMELEQLRDAARLDRKAAAKALSCAVSKIGHLETARNHPSSDDLRILTELYNRPDRYEVLWMRTGLGRRRGWWSDTTNRDLDGPADFGLYVGLEQGARVLRFWDPLGLNGLLHIPGFAEASIRGSDLDLVLAAKQAAEKDGAEREKALAAIDAAVQERAGVRIRRQQVLDHAQVHFVLGEMALRQLVGGPEVMREQYQHLLWVLENRPNVTMQVLLAGAGAHVGQLGPFTVMDFLHDPEVKDPGVVYLEDMRRARWYEEAEDINDYRVAHGELVDKAAPSDQTADIIRQFLEELLQ